MVLYSQFSLLKISLKFSQQSRSVAIHVDMSLTVMLAGFVATCMSCRMSFTLSLPDEFYMFSFELRVFQILGRTCPASEVGRISPPPVLKGGLGGPKIWKTRSSKLNM